MAVKKSAEIPGLKNLEIADRQLKCLCAIIIFLVDPSNPRSVVIDPGNIICIGGPILAFLGFHTYLVNIGVGTAIIRNRGISINYGKEIF